MGSICGTIYFLVVLTFLMGPVHGKRNFEIVLESLNCTVNPKYASESSCFVNDTLKEPRAFIELQLCREVRQVNYSLNVALSRSKYEDKITLINLENKNACMFLEGSTNDMPFVKIYRDILLEAGDLPKCPIAKNFRFVFKGLRIDAEKFPPYVPEAKFSMTLLAKIDKEFGLWAQLHGRVVQKHKMKHLILG